MKPKLGAGGNSDATKICHLAFLVLIIGEFQVRTNSCPNEQTRTNVLSRFPSLKNVVKDRRCVARKLRAHSSIDKCASQRPPCNDVCSLDTIARRPIVGLEQGQLAILLFATIQPELYFRC